MIVLASLALVSFAPVRTEPQPWAREIAPPGLIALAASLGMTAGDCRTSKDQKSFRNGA